MKYMKESRDRNWIDLQDTILARERRWTNSCLPNVFFLYFMISCFPVKISLLSPCGCS